MPRNASDVLVETLIAWDVDVIFGMPGDGGVRARQRPKAVWVKPSQMAHLTNAQSPRGFTAAGRVEGPK